MRYSGVTLALVSPVKPELVSPDAPDKTDIQAQILWNTIYSGASASDWEIELGPFLYIFILLDSLSNGTIHVLYSSVS